MGGNHQPRRGPAAVGLSVWLAGALLAGGLAGVELAPDPGSLLAGDWRVAIGDDPAWAAPEHDDSSWRTVLLPASWEAQGLGQVDGIVWFRRTVTLDDQLSAWLERGELGLLAGKCQFGGYELYAGGGLVGRSSGWALHLPLPRKETFPLPAGAAGDDGELDLALRVRRIGWASARAHEGAAVGRELVLGELRALRNAAALEHQRRLTGEVLMLLLAALGFAASLYHFLHAFRRRRETSYRWFGLLILAFAINIFFTSWWGIGLTDRLDVTLRAGQAAGHLGAAFAIQFLWPFLLRPIGRVLRLYQLSQVALALFVAGWPSMATVLDSDSLTWIWLAPLLIWAAVLILGELRRRRPGALVIGCGGLVLIAAELAEMANAVFELGWTVPVAPFGFAALLFSMGIALANRFRSVHAELDDLRHDLEHKVEERTADLAGRYEELQHEHRDLLEAQRQPSISRSAATAMVSVQILAGKYKLEDRVGAGGSGAIYRARHLELDREVAVKIYQPLFDKDLDAGLRRFRREGLTACRIRHPNAVTVLDGGITETGIAYLVMELLAGHDLGERLRRQGALSLAQCGAIVSPVCDVLAAAEEAGVVHRDVKPENIFLHQTLEGEVVKVVDFGIAKLLGTKTFFGGLEGDEVDQTMVSQILGTPTYMAPERLQNEPYDASADIYSLGMVLYQMIAGDYPFRGPTGGVDYRRLFSCRPPPPLREAAPGVSAEVEGVVMRALSRDPHRRPTAHQLARGLDGAIGATVH